MNYIYDIIAIRLDTKNRLLSYQRLLMYPSPLAILGVRRCGFYSVKPYATNSAIHSRLCLATLL